ncbi:MAG: methyltransferase [Candidatus Krumholzibacteriota bacterium]|nr:methyltransferase [Candidatus Krumholzibacteriota bacterium]
MKSATTEDVLALMDGGYTAAALGAALELGLFWRLADGPRPAADLARELGIPERRCGYWLDVLAACGLLEEGPGGYAPSPAARAAILDVWDRDSWAFLAAQARLHLPAVADLPARLAEPGSAWEAQGLTPPDYLAAMVDDPERARTFTRMLWRVHSPLAEDLAASLDLAGALRLMDLGGGSGVMSMALVQRHPGLEAVVVDLPTVCAAGREIVAGEGLADRVHFHAADFTKDELPVGFDVILMCDVSLHVTDLSARLRGSLAPGGRLVIVDKVAPATGRAAPGRLIWTFRSSMHRPDAQPPTREDVAGRLAEAGLELLADRPLPAGAGGRPRFAAGWHVFEARP